MSLLGTLFPPHPLRPQHLHLPVIRHQRQPLFHRLRRQHPVERVLVNRPELAGHHRMGVVDRQFDEVEVGVERDEGARNPFGAPGSLPRLALVAISKPLIELTKMVLARSMIVSAVLRG